MKAAYYTGNKKFEVKDVPNQPSPDPGMVKLDVAYCGICGTDIHIYHGHMDHRVKSPQVIGHEVSAIVAEIGEGVTGFEIGEPVAVRPLQPGEPIAFDNGYTHIGKNLRFIGIDSPGGLQESWIVPAYTLHKLPKTVSLQHAALIEPLAVACHDIRLGNVSEGEQVVVMGGGPIGVLIALVAKQKKARVFVIEINPQRISLIKGLGLEVINPKDISLVEELGKRTEGAMADVVFEVSGVESSVEMMTELLKVRGRIVMVAIHSQPKPVQLFQFFWKELRMTGARVYEPEDFEAAIDLVASHALPLDALITGVFSLNQVQEVFETIDKNPDGMKYLICCNEPNQ